MRLFATKAQRARDRLEAERLRLAQQRMRDEARRELEMQAAHHVADLRRLSDQTTVQQKRTKRTRTREVWSARLATLRTIQRGAVLAAANLGVNVLAITGQFLALHLGAGWSAWSAALAAAITESIALNVGFYAHDKLLKGYSALGTRLMSYGIGLAVGLLNYTHNEGHAVTGDAAVMFGAASMLSPILWHMYGVWRHAHNQHVQGTHKQPAPSFAKQRWLLPSLRGETWTAYKVGIAEGISDPDVCIALARAKRANTAARQAIARTQSAVIAAQRAQLELALTHLAAVSQEVYGADPDAAAAMENIARFVNRVGARLVPMYRPLFARPADEADGQADGQADEKRTDGADEKPDGRRRWFFFWRGRTADENTPAGRTNVADGKQTDGGRNADEKPANKRTDGADGRPRPGGRSSGKRTDGRRTNTRPSGRTNGGRANRTGGRTAGPNDLSELLPLGRTILAKHEQTGVRLTRDRLAAAIKADGQTISNERASALLHLLQTDGSSGVNGADGNGSSARTKKVADGPFPSATNNADGNGPSADGKGAN